MHKRVCRLTLATHIVTIQKIYVLNFVSHHTVIPMASNKCDFCGAPLPPQAKYCEECWKLLASPSHSRLRRYERRLIILRSNVFRGHTLTRTGKKRLVTGLPVILFILLVVGSIVSSHSNLYASNSIGERAMTPPLTPTPQVVAATPTATISPPSCLSPAPSSEVTVATTSAERCECLEQCDIMLYSPVMATPSGIPTPLPSLTAIPILTPALTTIESSPLLPVPAMILLLYTEVPTPYSPALPDGGLPANPPPS